jgi:hypothetical protein
VTALGLSGLKVLDGVVSGGNQIFYGVLDVAAGTTCSGGVCDEIHTGGRVRRLTPIGPVTVPGAPARAMFAARGRRLADVPLVLGTSSFPTSHSVDILNTVTGRRSPRSPSRMTSSRSRSRSPSSASSP